MNHDLGRALQDLANAGADQASPATILAGRATNRVAAHHRRRRAAISAIAIAGVAVVGTGAAAAISYFGDDPVSTFPDRLVPTVQAPITPIGLVCGAEGTDLSATDGPLVLGNEMAPDADGARVTISTEAGSIIPMFLSNVTDQAVTFTTTQNPGIYLVRDGHIVAVPGARGTATGDAAGGTLAPAQIQPLLEDRVVPCPDADGTTPGHLPAGDYDAYGVIAVSVTDAADPVETTVDVVGGPWKVRTLDVEDAPTDTPVTFPQADPDATFPQCGALLDPPAGRPQVSLSGSDTGSPLGSSVSVRAWGSSLDDLSGEAAAHPVLVAVKDGVVVGSFEPDQPGGTVPFTFPGTGTATGDLETTGSLQHTLCTDGVTPLPAGRYSIWAAQEFTITERIPRSEMDYVTGEPITTPESYTALDQVETLWMDASGQSVGHPGLAAGWPVALTEEVAFRGDNVEPETVVWLAVSARDWPLENAPELISARDNLADLGYLGGDVPFMCQPDPEALSAVTGVTAAMLDPIHGSGIGVMFRTRAEADTFTALWEPLHGPVAGLATAAVGCDFG